MLIIFAIFGIAIGVSLFVGLSGKKYLKAKEMYAGGNSVRKKYVCQN